MATSELNVWLPAAAALAGAFIGSLAPIIVGLIQSRSEHRRERMRLATQLAIEDYRFGLEKLKLNPRQPAAIPPISVYVAYHADLLNLLGRGVSISPEEVRGLRERSRAVMDATEESQAAAPKSSQKL